MLVYHLNNTLLNTIIAFVPGKNVALTHAVINKSLWVCR